MTNKLVLEIFSDYTWPWCYFITGSIEKLKSNYEITTRWIAYPLNPNIPEDGLPLSKHFSDCSEQEINDKKAKWKEAANATSLPLGERSYTYRSRLAHELGKWSESQGKGHEFHQTVFKAYFVDGKNIGKISILIDLAYSIGLSATEAQKVLENRTYKEAVDSDWSYSLEVDPEYIPSLKINGNLLVNPQKYAIFEQFMNDNGVIRRNRWIREKCTIYI